MYVYKDGLKRLQQQCCICKLRITITAAPLLYAAQPDSLGFFDDYVMHEPCLDEVGAESHCNVAMWLNDSMC